MVILFSGLFLWLATGVVIAAIGCRNGLLYDFDGWGNPIKASEFTKALGVVLWPFVLLILFGALLGQAVSALEKVNFPATPRQQTPDKMNKESEAL